MSGTPERMALRARFLFPVETPPIADGVLTVEGSRILSVGTSEFGAPIRELGDVAILPGLVNPHTHLEFCDLEAPMGEAGMRLPQWIAEVVARRRQAVRTQDQQNEAAADRRIARGLAECLLAGVTTLGEISTANYRPADWAAAVLRPVLFRELMAPRLQDVQRQIAVARRHVATVRSAGSALPALSPHAPYTACMELVRQVAQLSGEHHVPVAMHLAESAEEMELLGTGRGGFRDLLGQLGAPLPEDLIQGRKTRDYLQELSTAHRALVIHGNYLERPDWEFLGEHAANMSLIYCPRTHHYFGHPRYPLAAMMTAGVRVAIGTDSRASNPNLELLEELRFAARAHSDVAPEVILRAGTLQAAETLGLVSNAGSLTPGKRADLVVVQLPTPVPRDPWTALFDSTHPIVATYVAGHCL